jgi:hypothetical protein
MINITDEMVQRGAEYMFIRFQTWVEDGKLRSEIQDSHKDVLAQTRKLLEAALSVSPAESTAIPELIAEVRRLREALEFYANLPSKDTGYEEWYDDEGQRAREALEEKK